MKMKKIGLTDVVFVCYDTCGLKIKGLSKKNITKPSPLTHSPYNTILPIVTNNTLLKAHFKKP